MKKAIVTLLLTFLYVCPVLANKELLKEWRLISPTVRVINQGWVVGDSTITVFYESKKDGKRATSESRYYISDTKDANFDVAKVGAGKAGQYIIINVTTSHDKVGKLKIYEIESLTSTSLVVKASNGERFVFSSDTSDDESYSVNQLLDKTWVQETPSLGNNIHKWSFDKDYHTRVVEFEDGENIEFVLEYYLSQTKETEFDHSKVGVSNTGQYIIFYRKQSPKLPPYTEYVTDWYEILSLTPEKLVVKTSWGLVCTFNKK